MTQALLSGPATLDGQSHKLDSWKEIAVYLKRDITTVQRWERREGFPIHRHVHDKRGSVYAYRDEVDGWLAARGAAENGRGRGDVTDAAHVMAAPQLYQQSPQAAPVQWAVPSWRLPSSITAALVTLAVLIAVAVTVLALTRGPGSSISADGAPRIASVLVLPFATLSPDASQDYLAASMTEELTSRLAQVEGLRVRSRTTAASLQHRRLSMRELAREFQVDGVLEGAVRRDGTHVRVSLQLIHAPADTYVWTRAFDGDAAELPGLLTQIAQAVVHDLPVAGRGIQVP